MRRGRWTCVDFTDGMPVKEEDKHQEESCVDLTGDENVDAETRRLASMQCSLMPQNKRMSLKILLRMEDNRNRHLNCQIGGQDGVAQMAAELVKLGLVTGVNKKHQISYL